MGQTISISTRHGRISGWQAKPHDKPRGAVIVIQEIFGVTDHIRENALRVGDSLPGEAYFATTLGVSRAVMREASTLPVVTR